MIWMIENHVALTVGWADLVEAVALDRWLWRRDGKSGKIIGVDVNVVFVGHASGTRAEGAPVFGHLGTPLAMGGSRNPFPKRGIPATFRHDSLVA